VHHAADVDLVNLNDAREKRASLVQHRSADAVTREPCRLIAADLQHPLELKRRDPLLRLAHDVDGEEPLHQRELRVLEDRAHLDREALAA
jgi:23S rRNA G2445 N2-methylase RlmL